MKRAQIAIEFVILIAMSLVILLVLLVSINALSNQKTDEKTYNQINDLGISLQSEIILASEVENGYQRTLDIPQTLNGRDYNLTTGVSSSGAGYMMLDFKSYSFFYRIPPINDSLRKGQNTLMKINNTIRVVFS